jgi:RNA polymerase sigma-54 factor
MALHQKLHARLAQKLILTPSLQQAIKLLPMTTLELAELLNQEMVENPMLEEVQPDEQATETPKRATPGTTPTTSTSSGSISTTAIVDQSRRWKSASSRRSRTRCRPVGRWPTT